MPFIPYGYYWHHIFDVLKNGNYEKKKNSKSSKKHIIQMKKNQIWKEIIIQFFNYFIIKNQIIWKYIFLKLLFFFSFQKWDCYREPNERGFLISKIKTESKINMSIFHLYNKTKLNKKNFNLKDNKFEHQYGFHIIFCFKW